MIKRRDVLRACGAGLLVAHRPSLGQTRGKIPRVGFLWFGSVSDPSSQRYRSAFRQRLAVLGYVEGKNILIEERWAEGNADRLGELARELVTNQVDIIVAPAVTASRAARQATRTIPIVMLHAGDPIGAGLISNLARPGGNVTGTTNLSYAGKQVELMREIVPRAGNLTILLNPANAGASRYVTEIMEAAGRLNLSVAVVELTRVEDIPNAFAMIRDLRPDALLVMGDPFIGGHRAEVIAFAAGARLPTIYDVPNLARDGGLIAYGPLMVEHYVIAAGYVDRILKGAKPADLPVEQPTRFELIINSKTANALGLKIPQSLMVRADEVIQ